MCKFSQGGHGLYFTYYCGFMLSICFLSPRITLTLLLAQTCILKLFFLKLYSTFSSIWGVGWFGVTILPYCWRWYLLTLFLSSNRGKSQGLTLYRCPNFPNDGTNPPTLLVNCGDRSLEGQVSHRDKTGAHCSFHWRLVASFCIGKDYPTSEEMLAS